MVVGDGGGRPETNCDPDARVCWCEDHAIYLPRHDPDRGHANREARTYACGLHDLSSGLSQADKLLVQHHSRYCRRHGRLSPIDGTDSSGPNVDHHTKRVRRCIRPGVEHPSATPVKLDLVRRRHAQREPIASLPGTGDALGDEVQAGWGDLTCESPT